MGRAGEVAGAVLILLGLRGDTDPWRADGEGLWWQNHALGRHHAVLAAEPSHTEVRSVWRLARRRLPASRAGPVPGRYLPVDSHAAREMGEFLSSHMTRRALTAYLSQAPPSERGMIGTYCYCGAQFGTVVMLAVSGVLASSAMGWPSIFYFSGVAGLVWSMLYYFYGASSPSDCGGRISPEEKHFIESSLHTGDHGSKVKRTRRDSKTKN